MSDEKMNGNEEVTALSSVSVSLKLGQAYVESKTIDLTKGYCRFVAEHTGGTGELHVYIREMVWIDEAVKSWTLKPGGKVNFSYLSLPKKDRYYVTLISHGRNASGKATLTNP